MISKIKLEVQWIEDVDPSEVGVYLVALRHISGFGSYDYQFWDGEKWLNKTSSNIVGWSSAEELLNLVDAGWPESDKQIDIEFENFRKTNRSPPVDDDFVEID